MKTIKILLAIFALSLTLNSCKDKLNQNIGDDGLPHGENTLYYYVDGQLVIPETKHSGIYTLHAIAYGRCSDSARHIILHDSNHLWFRIYDEHIVEGSHPFSQATYDYCRAPIGTFAFIGIKQTDPDGVVRTYRWYTHPGSGYIRFDYVSPDKRKFKGTFEMTVYHSVTGEEKHITDGHFNINLNTLPKD